MPVSEPAVRDGDVASVRALAERIRELAVRPMTFMEVCGTHSMAIGRHGLRQLLPDTLSLLSGPGCPVCVTSAAEIEAAIALAMRPGVTVATFGDMMRVPGRQGSLSEARARGGCVRVVYSPMQAVELARGSPERTVVFIGVGFETTAPLVACAVLEAQRRALGNFAVLCSHKTIPPAMRALLESGEVALDGFLCPGHVSAILGTAPYEQITGGFGVACAIAGFEPEHIMRGLLSLAQQAAAGVAQVANDYPEAVRAEGNPKGRALMETVFEPCDATWRGIGVIGGSGLRLRPEFAPFDALQRLEVTPEAVPEHPACHCGEVLRGLIRPAQCGAFGRACVPERPLGPCMVSSEGACAAAYRYG